MSTNKASVLVVEDEEAIRRFLRISLEAESVKVIEARNGVSAQACAQRFRPDLYLVDLGLPDIDGITLITRLREWTRNPIIVLTARAQEVAKVNALDAGADDYLTKPFGIHELKARIRVALRRLVTLGDLQAQPVFWLGKIKVDLDDRRATRDGEEIHLTPTEFRMLACLALHPGKVITQKTLLLEVWGPAYDKDTHYLRMYVRQLRKKLEENPANPKHFLTEPGVGYRLVLTP
ncbi:MAG: response regulator [Burkholderiaceae bacterium]|jgi:two-component system KDP operon response regulator KdpE